MQAPPAERLPDEREQGAGDEADDAADEHRVPLAPGGDLDGRGLRHDLGALDVLREGQQLPRLEEVLDELPSALLEDDAEVREREPLDGLEARPGSDRGLVLVELASEPVELVLLAAGELAEGADLRVHVAGDALDDRLGEAVRRLRALLPPGPAHGDLDELSLARPRPRARARLRRDAPAELPRLDAERLRDRPRHGRALHDLVHGRRVRGEALDLRVPARGERLAEVDRRRGAVDGAAAERYGPAGDDPHSRRERDEPPAGSDRPPVAAEGDPLPRPQPRPPPGGAVAAGPAR